MVEGNSTAPLKIGWTPKAPFWHSFNGNHPLIRSLVPVDSVINARFSTRDTPNPFERQLAVAEIGAAFISLWDRLQNSCPGRVSEIELVAYLQTLPLDSLACMPRDVDCVFMHTVAVTLDAAPWVLHIENFSSLMWQILVSIRERDHKLTRHPLFWIIRAVLESPNCHSIATHMRLTRQQLIDVFDSNLITQKIRLIKPGVRLSEDQMAAADRAYFEKQTRGGPLRVLFSNSWHGDSGNFYCRGGFQVVMGFLAAYAHNPNMHLIIKSRLPEIDAQIHGFSEGDIRAHPGITIIEQFLSDSDMFDLVCSVDAVAIVSSNLHSMSLMQAMHAAAIPILSDNPLYREFVEPDVTAIEIAGIAERTSFVDAESGWIYDEDRCLQAHIPALSAQFSARLLQLTQDLGFRRQMMTQTRKAARERFLIQDDMGPMGPILAEAAGDPAYAEIRASNARLAHLLTAHEIVESLF